MPKTQKSSLDILNSIRQSLGAEYQERIPEATRANIAEVGNAILGYTPALNAYSTELLNRIGRTIVKKADMLQDIYRAFGEKSLQFGDTVQEIFVDIPTAHAFEGVNTENPTSMLAIEKGTIHVQYFRIDRKLFYKATISFDELREAFVSPEALNKLIEGIISGMERALVYDKYIMDTQCLSGMCKYVKSMKDGKATANVRVIDVPESIARYNKTTGEIEYTSVGAKGLLKLVRRMVKSLPFPHKLDYAPYSHETESTDTTKIKTIRAIRTPISNQIMALEVMSQVEIDVDALAVLFNLSKADLQTQVIDLEDNAFGSHGTGDAERHLGGFICSKDAFERYTSFRDKDSFKNPEHEYVNFWNHFWGLRSGNMFEDFVPILFKVYTPDVVEEPTENVGE